MSRALDYRPPHIQAGAKSSRDRARRVINILVTDSLRDRRAIAGQWKRAKVAGELVQVRQFTRRLKVAGAAVELHVVAVSLRPPVAP